MRRLTGYDMIKFANRAGILATVAVAALTLSACDMLKSEAERAVAAAEGGAKTQQKFDHYTEAFNAVIDTFGPQDQYESYLKLDIPNANPNASINFPAGTSRLQQVLDNLKKGRALNDGDQATRADAAADKLITAAEALLAQWTELEPYFETQAYRDDGLAKAKAAHPKLIAAYDSTLAAIRELDAALTDHLRARDQARAEAYKASGDMQAYHAVHTMQIADRFTSAVLEDDLAAADALLPELTASLKELDTTATTLPQDHVNKGNMTDVVSRLNSAIGAYREFKASKDDNDRQSVIHAYNGAVGSSNNLQFAT